MMLIVMQDVYGIWLARRGLPHTSTATDQTSAVAVPRAATAGPTDASV
jgi:hypothetical protein